MSHLTSQARNLEVVFDSSLSFMLFIQSITNPAFPSFEIFFEFTPFSLLLL